MSASAATRCVVVRDIRKNEWVEMGNALFRALDVERGGTATSAEQKWMEIMAKNAEEALHPYIYCHVPEHFLSVPGSTKHCPLLFSLGRNQLTCFCSLPNNFFREI